MLSGTRSAWRVVATAQGLSALLSVVAGFVPGDWFLSLHFQAFLYLVVFTVPDIVSLPFWVLGVLNSKRGLGLLLKPLFLAVSSLRCRGRTFPSHAPASRGSACCSARLERVCSAAVAHSLSSPRHVEPSGPRVEPMSPVLARGSLTTGTLRKPLNIF